jgi:hypothetical protein
MKFNRLTNILALASCALILWGCPKTPEQEDPKISANPTSVIFENTASTQTVTVASNRAWTVSTGVDWLTATPASKSGDTQESTTVTLTAKANDGALREATVTFKTATISATVKVSQKAAAGTEVTYTALSKLWDTYKDQVSESGKSVDLPVGVNVKARVISNIADGNCNNKSMYVEDGTDPYSGICVRYSTSDKNVIELGAEVTINMDGGTISNYNGTIQLTPKTDDQIVKTTTAAAVQAPVSVKSLTSEELMKYRSMYIATPKVQVVESGLKGTMGGSVTVQDEAGETIAMYSGTSSSQTASWNADAVPQGSGILNGIFVPYGSTLELLPQTKADWSGLTGARFTVAEGEATLVSIASVRGAASGSITDNNKIKGIVTSSATNKVNSSKTIFMQDGITAKSGIMLYISKAGDNTFEPGDEIEVKLKGASKTVYNGSDEISISDDGNITRTTTPNASVNPVKITVDQLKNENASWQSMYVVITDSVQVVKDSLNKMMTGNVIMETSKGTQFASYTRAGSAWADMKVPQGSGLLKGVASIYQGKTGDPVYQVIPQVLTDWNTLTGPRFGSVVPSQSEKKTISEINAKSPATTADTTKIVDDWYVVGTVVACVAQNFNKYAIAIEDGETAKSGLYVYCNNNKAGISGYALGDEVKVNLQGAMILKYNNINEVSVPSIDKISKTETAAAVKAPVKITYPQFLNGDFNSMYVEIDGFQAVESQLSQTMYNSTNKGTVYFESATKDTLVVYTNSAASIKDEKVPQGSGNIMGVVTPYKTIQELLPQTASDFNAMTGARFGSAPEPVKKSISEARELLKPAGDKDTVTVIDDIYVIGTVVTDISQNFANKGFCIEDAEAAHSGLYFYNASAALTDVVKIGDEVKVSLKGCKAIYYNGMIEVLTPSTDVITKTETANAVKAPVKVTIPEFENGGYESMYVQLDGTFQVIEKQLTQKMYDGTAKNNGNIYCETASKDTVDMYNTKYAAWKDNIVPQGSGSLCGVATAYKGIWQVQPQSSADFSGMTGTRFVPGGSTGPAAGTVLLEDNFDWITNVYCGDANHRSTLASGDTLKYYSKYGWPSSTNDYQNYNEYNVDNDTINTREQLRKTFQANYKTFARYEGFLKWGDSKNRGYAETVPMIGLGTATADLLVSFDAAIYANPAGVTDVDANAKNPDPTHDFVVAVNHGGTINETSDSTINIAISNFFSFRRYYVLVKGANAATTITFGDPSGDAYQERYYIDNLKIEVAASGATAPAPSTETTYLPYSAEVGSSSTIEANPFYSAVAIPEIRCSGPWTATSDADWLMFYDISDAYNTIGGITISEDGKTVTNNGNGLPFNNNYAKVAENNTGAARTGHITVVDYNGKTIGTITVSQRAKTTSDVAPVYKGNVQMAAKVTSGSAYVNNITMLLDNPTDTIQMNVKLGKSGAVGAWSSQALPLTGDMTLTFFAGAWQFLPCDLKVTVVGGGTIEGAESVTRTVLPNPGFNNDTPYHIAFCFPENYFSFKLAGITAASTLKFETVLTTIYGTKAYRVCIAGANVTQ